MWEAIMVVPATVWAYAVHYMFALHVIPATLYGLAVALIFWARRRWHVLVTPAIIAAIAWLPYFVFRIPSGGVPGADQGWARLFESVAFSIGLYSWPLLFIVCGLIAIEIARRREAGSSKADSSAVLGERNT